MQKHAHESGQISYDEATGLPLDPKMVADAIKEELMFMRKTASLPGSSCELLGQVWVGSHRKSIRLHEQG